MTRVLVALDIDGTLIDTRPSFTRIVKELSRADDDEIQRFRDTGGFNDDWELIRALVAWHRAGKPDVLAPPSAGSVVDVHAVVARCVALAGDRVDPGDMSAAGTALYRSGYWRDEVVLVDSVVLHALALTPGVRVAACTGRDTWEFERAQELLDFTFPDATTMEIAKKPDPAALLRLARGDDDVIVLAGDTAADRMCAERARATGRDVRFVGVSLDAPVRPFLEALARDVDAALHAVR